MSQIQHFENFTTEDIPWQDEKEKDIKTDIKKDITSPQQGAGQIIHQAPPRELSTEQKKFNQAMQMAIVLSRSSIVPSHYRGRPDDVFAAIQFGKELGFQPMQALNSIVMIQGNATMKAQTMLALVRARCPLSVIKITQEGDDNKEETAVKCFAGRDDDDLGYTSTWTLAKGKESGFATAWDKELKKIKIKDNWLKQPTLMCRWRAVSEALRIIFPDILMGLYSTEEAQDIEAEYKVVTSSTAASKAKELTEKFSTMED